MTVSRQRLHVVILSCLLGVGLGLLGSHSAPAQVPEKIIAGAVSAPGGVRSADVDGDGDTDVLSASGGHDTIVWHENDGSEHFTYRPITSSASSATDVVATDVDGDDDTDVLSASRDDDKIAWYENDGSPDPAFTAHTISTAADEAADVFATDLDGDGDPDVLSASPADEKVAWYENQSGEDGADSDGFGDQQVIDTGPHEVSSVHAADLDGDEAADVLFASGITDDITKVGWYENQIGASGADSDGFGDQQIITQNAEVAEDVFARDLDGDSDIDVLSGSIGDGKIAWHENDGSQDPSFTSHTITTSVDGAKEVFATDVDSDGDADLLSAGVAWYENDGTVDPSFTRREVTDNDVRTVFASDVDEDGHTDLLAAPSALNSGEVAWYENDGNETFSQQNVNRSAASPSTVLATDMDGDSDTDVLNSSTVTRYGTVVWYENDGSEAFTAHALPASENGADDIFATDVDGDGDTDVLSVTFSKVLWYENDGNSDPTFTSHTIAGLFDQPESVFAADLDSDGDTDVLAAFFENDEVIWYENDGNSDPTFTSHTITTSADGAQDVFASDVDSDGDTDVLSVSRNDPEPHWYENDGNSDPSFTAHSIATSESTFRPRSVFATDLDEDSDTDVLSAYAADGSDDKITWHENDGSEAFTPHTISTPAGGALDIYAADLNGDSDTDVLSATHSDNKVLWHENDGTSDPTFTPHKIATSPTIIAGVYAGDVDSDQDPDVLSAFRDEGKIARYENTDSTLPVELASFEGTVTETGVRLSWQTASETNNAAFRIERKTEEANGREGAWTQVGFVEGAGTTSESQSYRFTDADLPYESDRIEYRLKQVDTDGTAHLSRTITVERGVDRVRLEPPFPNPAGGQVTVRYALPEAQEVSLRLYDVLGREVQTVVRAEQAGRHERQVDLSGLSSGMYFLRLRAFGVTKTQRLTVVR